jgi:light-harvesting complex 1 alpha chain
MPPRSPVRTNIIIFTILGFVVALLIHFIVLSSADYNWLDNAAAMINNALPTMLAAAPFLF